MSGKNGMLHYSVEVKREAVRMFLEEHLTYEVIAGKLGIREARRIRARVHMFRQEGEASFHKPIGRPPKEEAEQRESERLRMEVALLKKFHTELRGLQLAQRNIG